MKSVTGNCRFTPGGMREQGNEGWRIFPRTSRNLELYKDCILLFAKYPEKGQVKTRLSAELDESTAVELYKNFVLDLLSMLERLSLPFQICFSPENSRERFMKWLGDKYCYIPQQGADLGQRMKNALAQAFAQDFDRAVIIGSDSPDLSEDLIHEAFSSLEDHDAVIGPSVDGGYYLIGFRNDAFLPEVFDGIEWSTDTVFKETLEILKKAGLNAYELPEWQDIDTLADLKSMFLGNHNREFRSSRTMSYIAANVWLPRQLSDS
ncbi:TIGR04282 family arsenosugar biosynthesis glycosyltransferase [Candidatus Poribacteria bacterium]